MQGLPAHKLVNALTVKIIPLLLVATAKLGTKIKNAMNILTKAKRVNPSKT